MKGFEYGPARQSVTLTAGHRATLPLVLRRSMDLSKRGWYPGDHHVHLFRHAGSIYPFINLDDVYNIAQGKGWLTWVSWVQIRWRRRPGSRRLPAFCGLGDA